MNRKEFEVIVGETTYKLAVRLPRAVDVQEADKIYSSQVAKLVQDKENQLLLRSQLEKFLREKNIWVQEDDDELMRLSQKVDTNLLKLRRGGMSLSEGRTLSLETTDARVDILQLMAKRRTFDESTIESVAENERQEYLLYASTLDGETGDRHWESFSDFKEDIGTEIYKECSKNLYILLGMDEDFDKNLPESQWLLKYGFVNDDLKFINRKTGKFEDRDGNPIDNTEEDSVEESEPFIDDETGEPVILGGEESEGDVIDTPKEEEPPSD